MKFRGAYYRLYIHYGRSTKGLHFNFAFVFVCKSGRLCVSGPRAIPVSKRYTQVTHEV